MAAPVQAVLVLDMGSVELLCEVESYSSTDYGRVDLRGKKMCKVFHVIIAVHVRVVQRYSLIKFCRSPCRAWSQRCVKFWYLVMIESKFDSSPLPLPEK